MVLVILSTLFFVLLVVFILVIYGRPCDQIYSQNANTLSWIRWMHNYPSNVLDTLKFSCVVAVVGNGKLTREYRDQINNSDLIIRINKQKNRRGNERTDIQFHRESGYTHSKLEDSIIVSHENKKFNCSCVVLIVNKAKESIVPTDEEREQFLVEMVRNECKQDKNIAIGAVRLSDMSSGHPTYAETAFPETKWGPSSGYATVVTMLDLIKKPNAQFHVYGMTPGWWTGKTCDSLTHEQCDNMMKDKYYRKMSHNPPRERDLYRKLQEDHQHIKFMWSV